MHMTIAMAAPRTIGLLAISAVIAAPGAGTEAHAALVHSEGAMSGPAPNPLVGLLPADLLAHLHPTFLPRHLLRPTSMTGWTA